ncbi:MAG: uracil-DNA glycosylase [Chloroflexi bacterium]|nr:uracil-DNA glycosylase [Chloroflexota bacterium]
MVVSELSDLHQEVRACPLCILAKSRTHAVPGEGPSDARILFVGEGPGFHEDQQGRPFIGAAGQFLNELLGTIGVRREEVYITNVVKCRPPGNRDPLPDEIQACHPYLERQIALIKPQVIVTLGRFSMEQFIPGAKISRVHGQAFKQGNLVIFPCFHPAAALHQPKYRELIEQDFKQLAKILEQKAAPPAVEEQDDDEPPVQGHQLSLF